MVRTQIYLAPEQQKRLRTLARQSGRKQSALIREAIDEFLVRAAGTPPVERMRRCRGMWRDRDNSEFRLIREEVEERLGG